MQVGYRHKSRFWSNSWLSKTGRVKCQKHLPTTKLSIRHSRPRTTGYRWIAERANYEVTKTPTTMQCRSHSRRLTSECLFVTACSMDEFANEKRTENTLIVRSVYLKPKQLIIKDCTRRFVLKLFRHVASRGLFATAELLVCFPIAFWASTSVGFRIVSDTLVYKTAAVDLW